MLESVKVEVPPERFLRTQEAVYRTQAELDGQRVVLRLAPNLPAVQMDRALIGRVELLGERAAVQPHGHGLGQLLPGLRGRLRDALRRRGPGVEQRQQRQLRLVLSRVERRQLVGRVRRAVSGTGITFTAGFS